MRTMVQTWRSGTLVWRLAWRPDGPRISVACVCGRVLERHGRDICQVALGIRPST